MENRKAVIFTGGAGPDFKRVEHVLNQADIIVAADSGWDLAVSMGITPDYYMGDMDSIKDIDGLKKLPEARTFIHSVDKDYSDTELSVKFIEDKHYRDIVLIGGGGGRIDHLLALTSLFRGRTKPSEWYTAEERVIYADGNCVLSCKVSQTLSIFSCDEDGAEVSTTGLKWELEKYKLDSGSFSLSNTALGNNIELNIHSGAVLVMLNY